MEIKSSVVFFLCLVMAVQTAKSQDRSVPMQYYDRVQAARDKASDYYQKKDPTPADIAKSLEILKNAIRLLDSVPVSELAEGNIYLTGRRHDSYMDMAMTYSVANQKDSAFVWLKRMHEEGDGSYMADFLQKDSSFINLRTDPRFEAMIEMYKTQGDLYKNTAFKTPYSPNLTDAEKAEGLSLLWMQARKYFVFFDRLKIDWNKTYMDYMPQVLATKSTAEYYRVLMKFYAQLHDGHSNVYAPKEISADFYTRPPFRTELIDGRVFVSQVFSDSLLKTGIVPGLEILKIDEQPVIAYGDNNVKPYLSSSTQQDMDIREFTYTLLAGPANKPIALACKGKDGKIFTRMVNRIGYHDVKTLGSVVYQAIGDIGYLQINDFENRTTNKVIDSLFKNEIAKTKGLIIDIRYNGGGDDGIGFNILRKLTDKPFKTSRAKVITQIGRPGSELEWYKYNDGQVPPDKKIFYDKPVMLLVGPRTFSAAEDFTVDFDYMKRGKIIGTPTGGSTGQPLSFDLPGGGSARVCSKKDTYPDGKEFVGIGIMPDITVTKTIKDLQNGKDAAKDKALDLLNK